jgi:hypothetical protein
MISPQASVLAALPSVFGKWEGAGLPYMYTDRKGLVTTWTGNLIDPLSSALALPWKRPDGSLASPAEVAAAWQAVKSAWPGVQSTACRPLTSLRLDADGGAALMRRTVAWDWAVNVREFQDCPNWPSDAQMALLSIDWAWGSGFTRVWGASGDKFRSLVNQVPQFLEASEVFLDFSQGRVQDPDAPLGGEEKRNPGIIARDQGTMVMFRNAANVAASGGDYSRLWYPSEAA